jgi:hypothetical protein
MEVYYVNVHNKENVFPIIRRLCENKDYKDYMSGIKEEKKSKVLQDTISNLSIYGKDNHPLILARDMGVLMGIKHINSNIKHYNSTEKVVGYIMENNKLKKVNFLTKYGVCRAFMSRKDSRGI